MSTKGWMMKNHRGYYQAVHSDVSRLYKYLLTFTEAIDTGVGQIGTHSCRIGTVCDLW